MKTTLEEIDGRMVATLAGEFDTSVAEKAEKILRPLYEITGKDIIIDCTALEYIASAGLRILLSIIKKAKAGGNKVTLRNVNEDIMTVFKLTGFNTLFDFENS